MKTLSCLLFSFTAIAGTVLAQNAPLTGIAETTDPAKIAEIEQRAQAISSRSAPVAEPAAGHEMQMEHHERKHHKRKHHHHRHQVKPAAKAG